MSRPLGIWAMAVFGIAMLVANCLAILELVHDVETRRILEKTLPQGSLVLIKIQTIFTLIGAGLFAQTGLWLGFIIAILARRKISIFLWLAACLLPLMFFLNLLISVDKPLHDTYSKLGEYALESFWGSAVILIAGVIFLEIARRKGKLS